ncbi:hypothetical protein KFK09_015046 [Dendrobium nobile]|uniref:Uncharacterized protein n=1 Tax=Dendrobium nobile TaxID=94219 RepID=A0A8T3B5L1_DENNO|nr:hypothetical protein KFK09_015046 [Dendrobium nobile]
MHYHWPAYPASPATSSELARAETSRLARARRREIQAASPRAAPTCTAGA